MKKTRNYMIGVVAALAMAVGVASVVHAASTGIVTKEELRNVLDNPDVIVLDVRRGRDWKSSEFKIKGAVRANPQEFGEWISRHSKGKRYVTYCA